RQGGQPARSVQVGQQVSNPLVGPANGPVTVRQCRSASHHIQRIPGLGRHPPRRHVQRHALAFLQELGLLDGGERRQGGKRLPVLEGGVCAFVGRNSCGCKPP